MNVLSTFDIKEPWLIAGRDISILVLFNNGMLFCYIDSIWQFDSI